MARSRFESVGDYLAAQPDDVRAALRRVRGTIRKTVPGAEETISYQIPAYKLDGAIVVYFAGWKEHYSLYPASDQLVAAFKGALTPYRASRGTLRFPLSEPVPVKLIERIVKFMAREAALRAKVRPPRSKKRR